MIYYKWEIEVPALTLHCFKMLCRSFFLLSILDSMEENCFCNANISFAITPTSRRAWKMDKNKVKCLLSRMFFNINCKKYRIKNKV